MARTTDIVDPERSAQMSLIRARDTKPELIVRRALHKSGLRYRLHARDLPGRPDIVFRKHRIAVFVHGCFWHQHPDPSCRIARLPKSNLEYWMPKLERNVTRDAEQLSELEAGGWRVLVVWECETKDQEALSKMLRAFLG